MEERYAREALVAKSQLRVKVNKIVPRASGFGPHGMRKCPLKRKMAAPVGQRSVCVACGKEGPHVLVEDHSCSWVLEKENGQRASGRVHTLRAKWSSRKKRVAKEKG